MDLTQREPEPATAAAAAEEEEQDVEDEMAELVELAIARCLGTDGRSAKARPAAHEPWPKDVRMAMQSVWTSHRVVIIQCLYYVSIFLVLFTHAVNTRLELALSRKKTLMCNFDGAEDRQEAYLERRKALMGQWDLGDDDGAADGVDPGELKLLEERIKELEATLAKGSKSLKVGIIGCGMLGTTLLRALLDSGSFDPDKICVSTRRPEALLHFSAAGVRCVYDNVECAERSDLLLLACLPAQFAAVAKDLRGKMRPQVLVISTVFGINAEKIKRMLGVACVLQPVFDAANCNPGPGIPGGVATGRKGAAARDSTLGDNARGLAQLAANEIGSDNRIIYTVLLALREWCETLELEPKEAQAVCVRCLVGDPRASKKDKEPIELFKERFLLTIKPYLDTL